MNLSLFSINTIIFQQQLKVFNIIIQIYNIIKKNVDIINIYVQKTLIIDSFKFKFKIKKKLKTKNMEKNKIKKSMNGQEAFHNMLKFNESMQVI